MAYFDPTPYDDARRAVGELVLHLQKNLQRSVGIGVNEVVKAGSLGHGTTVPGDFDLDLVIYSQDVNQYTVRDNGYRAWLGKLQHFLQQSLGRKFKLDQLTQHAVQFEYDGKIDVDLLLSPYWSDQHQFYDFLRQVPEANRFRFSVSASKWQVEFFQSQPSQVKEFISRAKAWRNKVWHKNTGGSGRPKSYLISLLVLRAYETASTQVNISHTQAIARQTNDELVRLVDNHHNMDIYWEKYYKRRDYPNLLPARPRIIDPANPANNLYKTGISSYRPNERACDYEPGDGNWTVFKRNIRTLDLTRTVAEIVIAFRGEVQHGQHPCNCEDKKEVTKGKKGKESGQSGGQSSPKDHPLPPQRAFTQTVGIETTEVFKGGSLGHGTTVPGHYDIDLVLYSRSIVPATAVRKGYGDTLDKLHTYLSEVLRDKYHYEDKSDVALKFSYTFPDGTTLSVDLLLSPFWEDREELLQFLQTIQPPVKRLMFSASASKGQTDFISHQPQRVKELIRRMKAWRNVTWHGSKEARPKSFLISLLVITAYNRVDAEYRHGGKFKALASKATEEVQWLVEQASQERSFDLTIPGSEPVQPLYRDLLPDPPRIIDPANPANNVYLSGIGRSEYGPGDGRWSVLAGKIGTLNLAITAEVIMQKL